MAKVRDPQRRAVLLDAGRQVLASRGVDKATIDEITQSAGVAKGTFYLYFGSKADLIRALRADFSEQIRDSLRVHTDDRPNGSWANEARDLVHSAVDAYYRAAPSYQAVLDCAAIEPDDTSWEESITTAIADFLREAVGQGACGTTDPEASALFLFHGINGICHHALHDPTWNEKRTATAIEPFIDALFHNAGQ